MEEKQKKRSRGVYHNDYSPRYQPAYDIYEKARLHMKNQKQKIRKQEKKLENKSIIEGN